MLDVWHKEEILAQNPDILCGHNSSRFDMDYMILQAAKMGKSLEEFMLWGRNHCPSELRRLGSKWSSTMWESIGRFHIDTCTFAAVYGKKQDKYDLRTTAGLLLKSLSKTENPKSRDYLDPAKTTRFQSMLRDFLVSSPPAAAGTASASAIASDDELKCGLLQTQQPFKFKHIDMLNKDKGDIDPLEIATMFHSPDVNERMKLFDYGLKDVIITLRLCIEQDMPMRSTVLARKFRATTDVMLNSGQNEKLAVALLGEMHTKGIVINDYSVPSMDPLEKATESFSYLGGFVQVPQRDMVKFKPTASKHVRQLHASSVAIQAEAKRAFEAKIAAAVLIEEEAKAKQQQQQQQQSHADSKRKFPDVATGELPASGSKETKSSRDEEAKSSASAPPLDSMDELLLHGGNAQRASRPSLGGLSAVTAYRLRSFDDVLAAQQRLRELARQTGSKECRGNALSDLQPGEIPPPPPLPEELIAPLPPSYMLDFISMYPSMMIGHHLDPQTLLETKFITPAQWAILRDKENCPWKWKIETVQGLRSNCITCLNMSSVLCACLFPWQVENTDGSKRETLIILGRWATEPVLDATTGEPIPGKRRFKMATTRVVEDKKTKTKTTISIEPERILEPMGICPQLQRKMKNLRAEVKGAIKKEKDPFKLAMMDLEQNAIKLFMNAMYGIFALENGQFAYCLLAAMITQLGRDTIQKCRDRAVELGKEQGVVPIYGDTDSAAFRMMMDAVIIAANVQFAQDILDRVPRDKALRKWSLAVIRRTFEFARKQADQISSEQFSDDLQFEVDKVMFCTCD
jgi:DNA polymerase elongation subunit (family B)